MNKFQLFFLLTLIGLCTVSCKTQEQIQREQVVDTLSLQMVQGQQNSGENLIKIQELQEQISKLRGSLDETSHGQKEIMKVTMKTLEDRLIVVEESNKLLQENLVTAQTQLKEQKEFLDKILKTLEKASTKSVSKKSKTSDYDQAMQLYRTRMYTKARPKLIELLKNKKIKGERRARVLHNLGMIEFIKKKNDDALIYFSQLFTEHSKSKFNANGLLYMAKAFDRLKRKEEAKQTLQELIKRYPKAKQVKDAQAMLK